MLLGVVEEAHCEITTLKDGQSRSSFYLLYCCENYAILKTPIVIMLGGINMQMSKTTISKRPLWGDSVCKKDKNKIRNLRGYV